MRNIIFFLIILIILFVSDNSFSQTDGEKGWYWQNTVPQGNMLNSITLSDKNTCFTVGNNGTILKTTNVGQNWININTEISKHLNDIHFIDDKTGYVTGAEGLIAKTTDGGNSWFILQIESEEWFYSVTFIDPNTGFVVGEGGAVYRTTNHGDSWNKYKSDLGVRLQSISFIDNSTGYVVGGGLSSSCCAVVFKTTNSGDTWKRVKNDLMDKLLYDNWFMSVHFLDSSAGFISGWYGLLLKTIDAGNNWVKLETPIKGEIFSVRFTDINTGYIAGGTSEGFKSIICKTTDGGLTWEEEYVKEGYPVRAIIALDSNNLIAVGFNGGIFKSTDAGNTWRSNILTFYDLSSVFFINEATGFITGYNTYLKTTNSGTNWVSMTFNENTSLYKINYLNNKFGAMIGNDKEGYIIHSDSQNEGYVRPNFISNHEYRKFFFVDSNTAFASGVRNDIVTIDYNSSGFVDKTTDGGNTWFNLIEDVAYGIQDIFFHNANTGFGVSSREGTFFKTTNAGVNWQRRKIDSNNIIHNITFTDANTGYVSGFNGTLYKTTDKGGSWKKYTINKESYNFSMFFINNNTGYISGGSSEKGYVMKTNDGGETWGIQFSKSDPLHSIFFINNLTGFAVGRSGTILKTTTGGEY